MGWGQTAHSAGERRSGHKGELVGATGLQTTSLGREVEVRDIVVVNCQSHVVDCIAYCMLAVSIWLPKIDEKLLIKPTLRAVQADCSQVFRDSSLLKCQAPCGSVGRGPLIKRDFLQVLKIKSLLKSFLMSPDC